MVFDTPLAEAFEKVDERWLEAFGGKELRLTGQGGVVQFRKTLAGTFFAHNAQIVPHVCLEIGKCLCFFPVGSVIVDTVRWILEIQDVGLMQSVIGDWLKAVVSPVLLPRSQDPGR